MVKQKYFVCNAFHVIVDINDDMFQSESKSSLEEDDKMLHKVSLVSIGAENKVSVQSGARIQEREKHASKEGTNFSMDQCWFQNGRLVWRENLVRIRHKYMAHSAKIRHVDSWQGESYFQAYLKFYYCRNNIFYANHSCCYENFRFGMHVFQLKSLMQDYM